MGAVDWARECLVLGAGILLTRHRSSALERRHLDRLGRPERKASRRCGGETQGFRDAN